ncbi:TetR family transcriptional regulator [Streptomyces sp. SID5470]|uniref:Transcriptional regulator n=1 Tax=Streptomyces sviceus (strain ATCC 29083 / DSM 924 / JCM 4929 / NBRC 13980 / NCIMB 11184 / NRRL 5439 / UC 5370) TaxID=463191 RepID=B5HPI1_STRX2|nr:helix-turn-helix domain-containing protein [Streptomyces sp. SID5470]EDY54757.1 transcriptional regulator [Streptomyces sviceus ATCC 29083]MYT10568.1 TetR family transcriptional regulator [Streptomyces sp. SID5470]
MPTSDDEQLPPGLALAWGLPVKTGRLGRKPSQSVEGVVEAAVALADAEGFAALSMPNIAKRVGLTANAIYRYVSSRDELLVLVAETAWGPAPDLETGPDQWRAAAATWTRAMIERCETHPWLPDLPIRGAPATPNLLRWTEVLLEALTGAGLSPAESLGCALLLDGYARRIASARRDVRDSSAAPVQSAAVARFLQPLLHEHGYPILASMMTNHEYDDGIGDDDVDFGLTRILDGIEVLIARRTQELRPRHTDE